MVFRKGDNPWNKGLTKSTDGRIRKYAKKLSVTNKGKIPCNKGLLTSAIVKLKLKKSSKKRWGKVKEHKKCSLSQKKRFLTSSPWNKGLTKEVDSRLKKQGEKYSERYSRGEIKLSPRCGAGKGGYRKDLRHYVRSTWEANVCRIHRLEKKPYLYEPKVFQLKLGKDFLRYTPDIQIGEGFEEIKGFMDKKSALKIRLFKKQFSQFPIKVIGLKEYTVLKEKYKPMIENWE